MKKGAKTKEKKASNKKTEEQKRGKTKARKPNLVRQKKQRMHG